MIRTLGKTLLAAMGCLLLLPVIALATPTSSSLQTIPISVSTSTAANDLAGYTKVAHYYRWKCSYGRPYCRSYWRCWNGYCGWRKNCWRGGRRCYVRYYY